jgi:hypothetical protein
MTPYRQFIASTGGRPAFRREPQVAKHDVVLHLADHSDPTVQPFFIRVASRDGHALEDDLLRRLTAFLRPNVEITAEVVPSRFAPPAIDEDE